MCRPCKKLQEDQYWDQHANPKAKRDQKREEQVRPSPAAAAARRSYSSRWYPAPDGAGCQLPMPADLCCTLDAATGPLHPIAASTHPRLMRAH